MEHEGRRGMVSWGRTELGTGEVVPVTDLDNDALILRLHFTVNHLSRWLTPIHDQSRLNRSVRRGEPSVKELMLRLRNEELRVFPKMHAISVQTMPNLDALPAPTATPEEERYEGEATVLELMAEFRRLRQSTCSLLRSLPDSAWDRLGISRREHDWTLRGLAERLADHDRAVLVEMDRALDRIGVRQDVARASRADVNELLRLAPSTRR